MSQIPGPPPPVYLVTTDDGVKTFIDFAVALGTFFNSLRAGERVTLTYPGEQAGAYLPAVDTLR